MKKTLTILFCAAIAIGATSCKKSWNCVCTDGPNQINVATYKETKLLDAAKKCDAKQADARSLNPNISCSIK